MCTPASAFAVVALQHRRLPPRPPAAPQAFERPPPALPRRRLDLLLLALLGWAGAGLDRGPR